MRQTMAQISGMVQVMELGTDFTLYPTIIIFLRVLFLVQHLGSLCHCYSSITLKCLSAYSSSVGEPVIEYILVSYNMASIPLRVSSTSSHQGTNPEMNRIATTSNMSQYWALEMWLVWIDRNLIFWLCIKTDIKYKQFLYALYVDYMLKLYLGYINKIQYIIKLIFTCFL